MKPLDRTSFTGLDACLSDADMRFAAPMSEYTSFKIGGPCDLLVTPPDPDALACVLRYAHERALPTFILGKGSNLLVADTGMDGIVISLARLNQVHIDGNHVYCEAGVTLKDLCDAVADAGLSGLEFACGIPGSLGGAVYMNAGAYDGEMKDVVVGVTVMDQSGRVFEMTADEMAFSYRHSRLKESALICLGAKMCLQPAAVADIRATMDTLNARRDDKQPLDLPSAGSTFKRPPGRFAGKLIIDAGLQGHRIGGAGVSMKHAGFIVNHGDATAADVAALIQHIQTTVQAAFDVQLEPEVRFVGRWS